MSTETNQMTTSEMKTLLNTLPKDIMNDEILVVNLVKQQEENLKKIKEIELRQAVIIESMTAADGKKLHSNETKREIALKIVLDNDKEYQERQEEQKKLREKLDTWRIEMDYLKRVFRSIEAISRMESYEN